MKIFPVFFSVFQNYQRVFIYAPGFDINFKIHPGNRIYPLDSWVYGALTNFGWFRYRLFSATGNTLFSLPQLVINLSNKHKILTEAHQKGLPSFGFNLSPYNQATYNLPGDMQSEDLQYMYLSFFITLKKL